MVKKLILPSLIAFTMLQADTNIKYVTEVSITNLYVSILDRSPRADGLKYWMDSGLSNEEIASSFLEQPETQDRYPNGLSDADFIQNIYQNIFDRSVDTEGFDYWYNEITTSKISRSQFILNVMAGAKGDDEKLIDNKTGVALAYAKSGNTDLDKSKRVLENITPNDGSVINTIQRYSLSKSYTKITTSYKLKVINDAKLKLTDPEKAAELKDAEEAALKAKLKADADAAAKVVADKKAEEEAAKKAEEKKAADKKAEEEAAAAEAANAVVVASAPVVPKDTVAPIITLKGQNPTTHEAGTVYVDAGATADDDKDGNITSKIIVTGAVTQMGTNILTYSVQDKAGNFAQEVNRTVIVKDTTAPTIKLLGGGGVDKNITVDFKAPDINSTLIDAQISDNLDTNLTTLINVVFNGKSIGTKLTDINTTTAGVYTLNYKVTDDYNNSAEANKTVIVDQNDTTAPFIQLVDDLKTVTLKVGDAPYDENITKDRVAATDAHDGDLTSELNITKSSIVKSEDNSTSTYKIYYNVTDKNGNKANQVIRVIKQLHDIEAPSIALNGDSNITLRVGDLYTDRGVLVGDNIDSVANIDINTTWFDENNSSISAPLDDANISTTEGNYTIRYFAIDKADNKSKEVNRTVTILEKFTPVEVTELNTTLNLTVGDTYRYLTYYGTDETNTITKTSDSDEVDTDANDITTKVEDRNVTYTLDSDPATKINQRVIITN